MDVRESYDSAARSYADHLTTELAHKPLNRHLLNRFAEETRGCGLVADLGCGFGHIARYLKEQGVTMVGIDISTGMISVAADLDPGIDFRIGDMNRLNRPDASLSGVVAFYSIVHFDSSELGPVLQEVRRVLVLGGLALVSFHAGEQVVHVDDLFGAPVSLGFRFHVPSGWDDFAAVRSADRADEGDIAQLQREPLRAPLSRETFGALGP